MIEDLPSKVRSRIFSELSVCRVQVTDGPALLGRDQQEEEEAPGQGKLTRWMNA